MGINVVTLPGGWVVLTNTVMLVGIVTGAAIFFHWLALSVLKFSESLISQIAIYYLKDVFTRVSSLTQIINRIGAAS